MTETGNEAPFVTAYYGTTDGGINPAAWDGLVDAGAQVGTFTALIEGLTPDTNYFYRMFASNSGGTAWAASSVMFTTLSPSAPGVEVLAGNSALAGSLTM